MLADDPPYFYSPWLHNIRDGSHIRSFSGLMRMYR